MKKKRIPRLIALITPLLILTVLLASIPVFIPVFSVKADINAWGPQGHSAYPHRVQNYEGEEYPTGLGQGMTNVHIYGTDYLGRPFDSYTNGPTVRGRYKVDAQNVFLYPPMIIQGAEFSYVGQGRGTLTMESYVQGDSSKNPVLSNNTNINASPSAYSYSGRDGTTYGPTTTKPTQPGKYTVSVTVGDDIPLYYLGYTATANFEVTANPKITYMDGDQPFTKWKDNYTPPTDYIQGQVTVLPNKSNINIPDGKEFVGWYENSNLTGDPVTQIPANAPNTNKTYYAKWVDNPLVTINYEVNDPNRGVLTNTVDTVYAITGNPTGSTVYQEKAGYMFIKWIDEQGNTVSENQTFKPTRVNGLWQSATYTAVFEKRPYKIVFDANGGSIKDPALLPQTKMDDQTALYHEETPLNPNLYTGPIGKIFSSWNTKADGTGASYANQGNILNLPLKLAMDYGDFDSYMSHTGTLYAQWIDSNQTVTINYQTADSTMGNVSSVTETVTPGYVANGSTAQPVTGYHLVNWTNSAGAEVGIQNKLDPPMVSGFYEPNTYTANFALNTYTVKFDGNGGQGTMADQNFNYNETKTLTPLGFTHADSNYQFFEWNTEADGSGTSYTDQQSVQNLTDEHQGVVTLYAQWKKKNDKVLKFVVYPDPNFGSPNDVTVPSPMLAVAGQTIPLTPLQTAETTCNGIPGTWLFDGWAADEGVVGVIPSITMTSRPQITEQSVYGMWTFTPSYQLEITKINNDRNPLSGAGFQVYSNAACTTVANVYIDDTKTNSAQNATAEQLRTDSNGLLNFYGLEPGNYWLKETATPSGYSILSAPVPIQIGTDGTVTVANQNKPPVPGTGKITLEIMDNAIILDMPGTGFGGVLPFIIIGIAVILVSILALGGYSYHRKRH